MVQRAVQIVRVTLLLFCATGCLWCQAQDAGTTSGTDTVYALHGTVVDGTSGKPVEKALVVSADRRLGKLTDSEGRFSFELSVPAQTAANNASARAIGVAPLLSLQGVVLMASKPGYLQTSGPLFLPIGAELSAKEVTLKLMPMATISGHVSASGTEFASNVQVILLRRDVDESGKYEWGEAGIATTNGHGDYHFAVQIPGEVTVVASGWRGDPVQSQPANVIHNEYPKTFYGNEKSLGSAVKLQLHYGETVRADLHMQAATYYPVTIPVLGLPASGAGNDVMSVQIMDEFSLNDDNLSYNAKRHAVEGSLPAGSYTLLLNRPGDQAVMAVVPVNVEGAVVRSKPVTLGPAASVAVQVRTDFTRAAAEPAQDGAPPPAELGVVGREREKEPLVNLTLQPEGLFTRGYETPGGYGDTAGFVVKNVPPGRFTVRANPHRGYVASLTSGGVDLTRDPLVVEAGATVGPIEVILRDDSSTVNGTVTADAEAVAVGFVFLLPTDANGQVEQTFFGPGGKFSIENVVPGSYRVIALSAAARMIPYRDAAAMHKYDGKGTTIKVGPGQTIDVEVPTLEEADAEDGQRVE